MLLGFFDSLSRYPRLLVDDFVSDLAELLSLNI
jgi:hypothetical protein